jgi:hypothetical protein
MRVDLRFLLVAMSAGFSFVVACGGPGGGFSEPGPDGGNATTPPANPAASAACDAYFDAMYASGCSSSPPPASELARIKPRFRQQCTSVLLLPGNNVTVAALSGCATAVAADCSVYNQSQGPCRFSNGSRAGGATCLSGSQCQTGDCANAEYSCGTCEPVGTSMPGQPCTGNCAAGSICSDSVCVTQTFGAVGASCDGVAANCSAGLVCNSALKKCAAPGAAGAPCLFTSDCKPGLSCPGNTASTCQGPGMLGATCAGDSDCGAGLACETTTHKCATLSWVGPGQTCDSSHRCLVGSCVGAPGTTPGNACPTVIADGQPCVEQDQTKTCDTFAECFGGVCHVDVSGLCP